MRISLTAVLEVNFVWGKLFKIYCIRSTGKDQIDMNNRRNFDLGFRGEVFWGRKSHWATKESLFRKLKACVVAVYPRWKRVAADKPVFAMLQLVTLTRLTAVICMKVRLKVKVTRSFPLPPCCRSLSEAEKTFKKNFWDQGRRKHLNRKSWKQNLTTVAGLSVSIATIRAFSTWIL